MKGFHKEFLQNVQYHFLTVQQHKLLLVLFKTRWTLFCIWRVKPVELMMAWRIQSPIPPYMGYFMWCWAPYQIRILNCCHRLFKPFCCSQIFLITSAKNYHHNLLLFFKRVPISYKRNNYSKKLWNSLFIGYYLQLKEYLLLRRLRYLDRIWKIKKENKKDFVCHDLELPRISEFLYSVLFYYLLLSSQILFLFTLSP